VGSSELAPELAQALAVVKRGCQELLVESEFVAKLRRAQTSGKPLRCKLGLDPTAPDIHLGHTVVLNKLRQLQDLGHTVIFLIGDFTSLIGDPSGRNATRPPLTAEQIRTNALTYFEQAAQVLIGSARGALQLGMVATAGCRRHDRLASSYTLARLLERDDFSKRFAAGQPIAMHELLYPLMQGYDSVALRADLELGGTDQNSTCCRRNCKALRAGGAVRAHDAAARGLDGVEKMSKSKGNYVGINEARARCSAS